MKKNLNRFTILVERLGLIGVPVNKVTFGELQKLDEYLEERKSNIKTLEDVQCAVDQFFKSNK